MFEITNKTKGTLPSVPFCDIKNAVLGKKYDLSLVFIGDTRSRKLNNQSRGVDKPTNILSFPLDEQSGEIFIDLRLAKKQAPDFEKNITQMIGFLFIHGLLHLKGYDHGSTMESKERAFCKRFNL